MQAKVQLSFKCTIYFYYRFDFHMELEGEMSVGSRIGEQVAATLNESADAMLARSN